MTFRALPWMQPWMLEALGLPVPPPDPTALRVKADNGRRGCWIVTGPEDEVRRHADEHRRPLTPLDVCYVVEEPHEVEPGVWRAVVVFYWQDN